MHGGKPLGGRICCCRGKVFKDLDTNKWSNIFTYHIQMSTAFYRYVYNRKYALVKNRTIPIATSPSRQQMNDCYSEWKRYLDEHNITTNNEPDPDGPIGVIDNPAFRSRCRIRNIEHNRSASTNPNSNVMSTNMRISRIIKYQQTQVPNIFAIY